MVSITDIIVLIIVGLIIGGIIYSLIKNNKEGKCNHCPYNKSCNKKTNKCIKEGK